MPVYGIMTVKHVDGRPAFKVETLYSIDGVTPKEFTDEVKVASQMFAILELINVDCANLEKSVHDLVDENPDKILHHATKMLETHPVPDMEELVDEIMEQMDA